METFTLYVKSHIEAPDQEYSVEAENFEDAIDLLMEETKHEYDFDFVLHNTTKDEVDGYDEVLDTANDPSLK